MSKSIRSLMVTLAVMCAFGLPVFAQEQQPVTTQQGDCRKAATGTPEAKLEDLFMQLVEAYNHKDGAFIYAHAEPDAILYRFEGYEKDPQKHPNVRNGIFVGMKDYNNEMEWNVLYKDFGVIKNAVSPCFRQITVGSDGASASLLADYYFQYTEQLPPNPGRRDIAEIRASVFFNCSSGTCKIANGSFLRTDVIGGEKLKKR